MLVGKNAVKLNDHCFFLRKAMYVNKKDMLTPTFLVVACPTLQEKVCFKKAPLYRWAGPKETVSSQEPGVVLPPVDCIWKVPLVVEGFFEPREGATVQCQVTNLKLTAQAPLKNGGPPNWFWRYSYWKPPF